MRIGQGFDAHRLVPDRPLVLGGIQIAFARGLEGHSDGDVLLHAVADAVLGALGQGDLGRHFPSSRPDLAGVASRVLLEQVGARVREAGFAVAQVDATVIAEAPPLAPHLPAMAKSIADALRVEAARVNVKAKSTDGLGAVGRGEGMAALAVALLEETGSR